MRGISHPTEKEEKRMSLVFFFLSGLSVGGIHFVRTRSASLSMTNEEEKARFSINDVSTAKGNA